MKDCFMVYKRLNITLHDEDIKKLDRICKQRDFMKDGNPKRSTMIQRLIQEAKEK
jgi:metal-responsive CopG/Arc/MetJ family transcriptional regulator